MKKLFKRLWKKTAALLTAGAVALTLAAPAPAVSTAVAGTADTIGAIFTLGSMAAQISAVRKQVNQLNDTEEGRTALFLEYKKQYGVNEDPYLNQKLERIMANLTAGVAAIDPSINDQQYKWFINKDETINAACSFGHVMMVNTGLLDKISNEDEIAAVIGHEMGHGQKEHVKKGVMKGVNRTFVLNLAAIAAGGGIVPSLAASVANIHIDAHSTKKHEWEADNMAFEYLQHTNYNLGAGAALQQKFVELMGDGKQSSLSRFFNPSDHPNSEARRDNYIKKLAEYSGGHIDLKDGTVTVNKKLFVTPTWSGDMSGAERACFVLGNLAAAYHNGHAKSEAYANGNTIYLGAQPIMTVVSGDEPIQVLVDRLNANK